jgi:hypothetical protein
MVGPEHNQKWLVGDKNKQKGVGKGNKAWLMAQGEPTI